MSADRPPIDLERLREWIGRERVVHDDMRPFPAQALAAALDQSAVPAAGEPLPPAWHWLYFLEAPAAATTGPDGHVQTGGFLPPVPLPRRMWAGGRFEVVSPLVLGRPSMRRSTVRAVTGKSGRSGSLVFVTLEHELSQEGRPCIREQQDLVYREMPAPGASLPAGEAAPGAPDLSLECRADPVLLFRYSALTYNAHRIHYDRRYAMEQEHYPALVVHGPLLATQLLGLVPRACPGARVTHFEFRAVRPTFDLAPYALHARRAGQGVELWSTDGDGHLAMRATATVAQPAGHPSR